MTTVNLPKKMPFWPICAVAGNEIEKRVKKTRRCDVTARLQGGGTQTISFATAPAFKVGDKVRVENGTLVPNS